MNLAQDIIHLTPADFQWFTAQLFHNNCRDDYDNLTVWKNGLPYMSLGIGHFTWYPRDTKRISIETFPRLLDFLEADGVVMPPWLAEVRFRGCPWNSRKEFLRERHLPAMTGLREFLHQTVKLQVGYIVHNAMTVIERISSTRPASEQQEIIEKFQTILATPHGFYPLIDYVSFKGGGCKAEERYQGVGWGLLQVLTEMKMPAAPAGARRAFAEAAVTVLERRVANQPTGRHEEKLLPSWRARVRSYLE
ncbi:MAG: hypothetical protein PHQ27_10675 [Victivallales bacterium]|nr:hypothetical protein [Victivallales bacterium]